MVVLAADAGVEPHAVMVEPHHTLVAVAAVFAGEADIDLAEIAINTVLQEIMWYKGG